ncbi:MAG: hypothetical protein P1V51_03130 [Deltaproteobacteria bacterium]|nr:hypothetical protein [Deltaproteobacteria bacterium]
MKPRIPTLLALALLGALSLSAACGGKQVKALSIFDERLPPDSRRWVADADDQIIVARAWRDEMRAHHADTRRWKNEVVAWMEWPQKSAAARKAIDTLADQRLTIAELERDKAETQFDLALAKWELVMAETAMRHDIAIYELAPLEERVKGYRAEIESIAKELETEKLTLEKVEAEWWRAFAEFVKLGGRGEVLWVTK